MDKVEKNLTKQTPSPAARTVTVACKLPNGLVLRLQQKEDRPVESREGTKMVTFWVSKPGSPVYRVRGPEIPRGGLPEGYKVPMIVGGYALTPGIPAEFWEEWAEQNKLADYFLPPEGCEHGAIFAYPSVESASDAADEQDKYLTGFEPMSTQVDKNGRFVDPRVPRPLTTGVAPVGFEPRPTVR